MEITPPPPDLVSSIIAEHPSRYPEKFTIVVIGDGGKRVRLPFLLGNPSGACEPNGTRITGAWASMLAAALQTQRPPANLADLLAQDCVLWPERPTLAQWAARWPGLPKKIGDAIAEKVAAVPSAVVEPVEDEAPPEKIGEVLTANERAVWRWVRPRPDATYAVAINTPAAPAWRIYQDGIGKPKADPWKLSQEMVQLCTIACVDANGAEVAPASVTGRFPGLVPLFIGEIAELVGLSADVISAGW